MSPDTTPAGATRDTTPAGATPATTPAGATPGTLPSVSVSMTPATLPPGQASSQSTSKYDSVPGPLSPLRVVNVYFDVNATNLPLRFKSTCRYVRPQLARDDVSSLVTTFTVACSSYMSFITDRSGLVLGS